MSRAYKNCNYKGTESYERNVNSSNNSKEPGVVVVTEEHGQEGYHLRQQLLALTNNHREETSTSDREYSLRTVSDTCHSVDEQTQPTEQRPCNE